MKRILILYLLYIITLSSYSQTINQNYVLSRTFQTEDGSKFLDQIQYFDGLGRPIESVKKGITQQGNDLVTFQEYDITGRDSSAWLAVPIINGNGNYVDPQNIRTTAISFYGDNAPYSKPIYEPSSLDRVRNQFGAGSNWQNNNKAINTAWFSNENSGMLACAWYEVNSDVSIKKKGMYPAKELFVTKKTDEDGHISYVFTNKQEQTLLIRETNYGGCYDTYYIYDDLGNLRYILPPLASDALTAITSWDNNNQTLKNYAYIYQYDERCRCVEKKLPGCEPIYMVYNKADRLTFSQDGEQRKKGLWMFYIFDELERPVLSGLCISPDIESCKTTNLKAIYTDNITKLGGYILSNSLFQCSKLLAIKYYDNYNFLKQYNIQQSLYNPKVSGFEDKRYGTDQTTDNNKHKGLITGVVNYSLNKKEKKFKAFYYDYKGQIIQTHLFEPDSIKIIKSANYSFTGKITFECHQLIFLEDEGKNIEPGNPLYRNVTETFLYKYDHADRLIAYNNCTYEYDELGRLNKKTLSNVDTINYSYNIRSWTKSIKSNDFSEELLYNNDYNGNISRVNFKQNNQNSNYSFQYDNLNRLTSSNGELNINGYGSEGNSEYYSYDKHGNITELYRMKDQAYMDEMTLSYNGNQLSKVCDLSSTNKYNAVEYPQNYDHQGVFQYDTNGNLTAQTDKNIATIRYNILNLPDTIQFMSGNQIVNSYFADGTLYRTRYRTCLIPPTVPVATGGIHSGLMNYIEDTYLDKYQMKDGSLFRITNPEGYTSVEYFYVEQMPVYIPHYVVRDHLGNTRTVKSSDKGLEQSMGYYASGAPLVESFNPDNQPYKFGDKELISMHELNWYNFGARYYDPVTVRFTTPDPLTELKPWISGYAYCLDNPIRYIDPTGLFENRSDAEGYSQEHGGGAVLQDVKTGEWFVSMNAEGTGAYASGGTVTREYGSDGNKALPEWTSQLNLGLSSFGIGHTAKSELIDWSVRDYNKLTSKQFNALSKNMQTIKQARGLGKTGVKYLRGMKAIGKASVIANVLITGKLFSDDVENGRFISAGARTVVFGITEGANFIPIVGPFISAGMGFADAEWGDGLYNYLEEQLGN